jgi:transposase InsO family protein
VCPCINSFYSLLDAQVVISDRKIEYKTLRRHSALGYLAPADYARRCTHEMETDESQSDRT